MKISNRNQLFTISRRLNGRTRTATLIATSDMFGQSLTPNLTIFHVAQNLFSVKFYFRRQTQKLRKFPLKYFEPLEPFELKLNRFEVENEN